MIRKKPAKPPSKPRRVDGWSLCDELNGGKCTCRINARGPCNALVAPLQISNLDPALAAKLERQRMAYNRHMNSFFGLLSADFMLPRGDK